MQCPNCKYANPAGATHCGMCYEVFNRSAAETFLRHQRRERRESEVADPSARAQFRTFLRAIGWPVFTHHLRRAFRRQWGWFLFACPLAALALAALMFDSPDTRLRFFGARPQYVISNRPTPFLVGFHTDQKIWTELQAHFDAPIDESRVEELGNLTLVSQGQIITASVREWITQNKPETGAFESQTIPAEHPSIQPTELHLDSEGRVASRGNALPARTAKALLFAMPAFPPGTLSKGARWDEPVRWVDIWGEFKIYWTGTLRWSLLERINRGGVLCDFYTCTATLHPQMWSAPAWCAAGLKKLSFRGQGHGEALFDIKAHRIFTNNFTYEGTFNIPISDVRRVPDDFRVGREVHGAGRVGFEFHSKIDVASPSTR